MIRRLYPLTALFALALPLLLLPSPALTQETRDSTLIPEALQPVRAEVIAAWMSLDASAAKAHFAEDAELVFREETVRGAAVDPWLTALLGGLSDLALDPPSFHLAADEVVERRSHTLVGANGARERGSSETRWIRTAGGSWKVTRLHIR
jgi:hypothetical protein